MDFKKIQELIKLIDESNISEVKIEEETFKVSIRTKHYYSGQAPTSVIQPIAAAPLAQSASDASSTPHANNGKPADPVDSAANDNLITIKAPMIGTLYRKAAPDKPIFVNVGDTIKPGDVLCIIEAMKLFNEIESEVSGKIVKVFVDDASPVEYDQPLFLVEPN